MKKRLFSAVQPSGNLHLGNYLGALQNWVKLQDDYEAMFCVVDLHAITVPQDPAALRQKTLEIAKMYLAAGVDPAKCTLFVQSHVKEHTELAWILNTIAKVSELERMTQFKDKSQKDSKEGIGAGLLTYPVLMAADILLYDTVVVPVGKDQMQHIELARTLARRFNDTFGETFAVPECNLSKEGALIMALDDPAKKMSKSAASEYNYIALTDDAETVRKKIKKAVTDSGTEIVYSDSKPALKNLLNIYALLSDKKPEAVAGEYAGKGYADFKNDLAEVIVNFLAPFQERLKALSDEEVLKMLAAGAEKARTFASEKMVQVRTRVGFLA
ncbi:MAG: tryptophan--tRNA ligase [Candidatus Moranbacteria bacterium RIFCSPHIGHO2_12_FULL_54_9]|nr:MAG: tryptophan--tRNA ligase [Candidatus Moranbacteria bacterium RIFCSPHIGHO2_01_FULL_54_31]OGI24554.1 MAG: tryptophan--tRNA ligase [Candidatus Moranbacteria bacterium RIFCSPHIGHO2_12_FULL_54_9]